MTYAPLHRLLSDEDGSGAHVPGFAHIRGVKAFTVSTVEWRVDLPIKSYMKTRQDIAAEERRLHLLAAELEYEELLCTVKNVIKDKVLAQDFLVVEWLEANPDALTAKPFAADHAVVMRAKNCKRSSLAIYVCWISGGMLLAAAAVLGLDKQLWPAVANACLGGALGKALPDWISTYYLKPEEKRLERWQKQKSIAASMILKNAPAANDVTRQTQHAVQRWP